MDACYLGIDTSNYTTSVAITDSKGNVLFDKRILLSVKPGEIGLRQSDAFYQHVMNLPGLFCQIPEALLVNVKTIAVSEKPRQVEGSYMPVFNAGVQFGKVIGKSLNKPIHYVSHQDGHIMAALTYDDLNISRKALNLHISGGTTELFLSQWCEEKGFFVTQIVGGTKDLSIGQLIDRIGVYMGEPFPAGKSLTEAVQIYLDGHQKVKPIKLPLKNQQGFFNLSGIENKLKQLVDSGQDRGLIAYSLFIGIGEMLSMAILSCLESEPSITEVILAGGVMSNPWIRHLIGNRVSGVKLILTEMAYCTDNAVGVSRLAKTMDKSE